VSGKFWAKSSKKKKENAERTRVQAVLSSTSRTGLSKLGFLPDSPSFTLGGFICFVNEQQGDSE